MCVFFPPTCSHDPMISELSSLDFHSDPFFYTQPAALTNKGEHRHIHHYTRSQQTYCFAVILKNPSHTHKHPLPSGTQVIALFKGSIHGVVGFIYFGFLARMSVVKLHFNEPLYKHSALEPAHLTQVRGFDPYMPCI